MRNTPRDGGGSDLAASLRHAFGLLIGDERLPLEQRLFTALSLLNGLANVGGSGPLLYQRAYFAAGLQLFTGALFLAGYYLSRFREIHRPLYWPFVILIALFLPVNAVTNGGSTGGAFLYFTVGLVIAVILFRTLHAALLAFLLFSASALAVLVVEQVRPDWVISLDTEERILDVAGNLLFSLAFVALLVLLLSRNLNIELNKSERLIANISAVMDSATDAIISADHRGNVISWNPAAERMFGFTESEILGSSLTIIIPERYRQAHHEGIARVNRGGQPRAIGKTVELAGLRKDGSEFPIELSLSRWDSPEGTHYSGIIRDVSARKEAEEKLRLSQEQLQGKAVQLETANQEIEAKNEQLEGLASKLAKYLSHQVYDSIFSGQKDVKIESYRKKLTVFFSDIQGFTDLTDRMEPEALSSLLNHYLDEMSKIALRYGGTIDKFIGDAIMIFFGDPETKGEKEDALACARMALEMRDRMKALQRHWVAEKGIPEPLRIRIGINTGFCTVGNFGSEERLDYTIVGGQVNLASRLESLAQTDQILISHDTYSLIQDEIACLERGEIQVKGIARPVKTYQIVDFRRNLSATPQKLEEAFDGFSLRIDLEDMGEERKNRALSSLRRAIERLEGRSST